MGTTIDRDFKYVILFGILYAVGCFILAFSWYNHGYFKVYDIFFDTDPNANLGSFAHGTFRHAISHAFIEVFAIPFKLIVLALYKLGMVSDMTVAREIIALSIGPLSSALTIIIYYRILKLLDLNTLNSYLITLIFAFSFSNILFAIIVETYAVSGFLISLLFYYFVLCKKNSVSGRWYIWLGLGTLLTGITITNVAIFFIVYMGHNYYQRRNNLIASFTRSLSFSLLALIMVVGFYLLSHLLLDYHKGEEGGAEWVKMFLIDSFGDISTNFTNILGAFLNTFTGLFPSALPYERDDVFAYNYLSFQRTRKDFVWLSIAFIMVVLHSKIIIRSIYRSNMKEVFIVSTGVILFNIVLHSVFGREMFMYSKHWIIPLSLTLIPVLSWKKSLSISIIVFLIITNAHFLINVHQLIDFRLKVFP